MTLCDVARFLSPVRILSTDLQLGHAVMYNSNTPESLFSPEKELKTYSHLENLKINVSLAPRTLKRTFVRVNVQEKLKKIQGD